MPFHLLNWYDLKMSFTYLHLCTRTNVFYLVRTNEQYSHICDFVFKSCLKSLSPISKSLKFSMFIQQERWFHNPLGEHKPMTNISSLNYFSEQTSLNFLRTISQHFQVICYSEFSSK